MTAQELKNSILQLAIQGKLVKQDPSDEPASVLLEKIKEEREKLIEEKKIKKEKYSEIYKDSSDNYYYEKFEDGTINDITDEIPFEIPESWKWTRLKSISNIITGYSFKGNELKENKKVRVIRISDFDEYGLKSNKIVKIDENKKYENYIINNHSILLAMTGGTVGKSYLLSNLKEKMYLNQRVACINCQYSNISIIYLYYVIISPFIKDIININKNSTNDNISMELINNFLVPLPSLEEQKRITLKLQSLITYISEYDQYYNKLENLNNNYKVELKKSILQYAIQGKLVKQDLEDESAEILINKILDEKRELIKSKQMKKENLSVIYKDSTDNQFYEKFDDGKIVNITDEIPFDIPDNWAWTRLANILTKLTDGTHKTPRYVENGVPFVSVKDMSSGTLKLDNTKYITKEEHKTLFERCNPQKGDIILSKIGTTGIPVIVETDIEFSLFVSLALLKFNNEYIDREYLKNLILSPLVQKQCKENTKGVGNKNWVMKDISRTLIVIPPHNEQVKIIEKLNTLFSII